MTHKPTARLWAETPGVMYKGDQYFRKVPGVTYPDAPPQIKICPSDDPLAEQKAITFLLKTGITIEQIRGMRGSAKVCIVRRELIAHLAREGYSARHIGRVLNRDHAGILYNMPGGRRKDHVKNPDAKAA